MHQIQEKILKLMENNDLGKMTLRAIGEAIGEPNKPQLIKHHLDRLTKLNFLKVDKNKKTIERVKSGVTDNGKIVAVPILGSANCGEALYFGEENYEGNLLVSTKLLNKRDNIFAVKAVGPSMNKAKVNGRDSICDGDYVIVDREKTIPSNGDYVLSVINGMMNIKKFYRDSANKQIVLVSESTGDFAPIYIHEEDLDDYMNNGTIIQVMKRPSANAEWQDAAGADTLKHIAPISREEFDYYNKK
jgi:SOS-response transcriptional repressor LexA